MSFLSEYATARQTQQNIGEDERAMARTRLADTAATNARMESLKKADADRRYAAQGLPPEYSMSGTMEPGQAAPAPGAQVAAATQGRGKVTAPRSLPGIYDNPSLLANQTEAETMRLARMRAPGTVDPRSVSRTPSPESMVRNNAQPAIEQRAAAIRKLNPADAGVGVTPLQGGSNTDAAKIAQLKAADAAIRGQNAPTDFVSRIRQAESGGNMAAVGRNIPGQGTAKSDMQVMDKTNLDPGFGVRPAQNNSVEERSRVGRDYATALLQRYGNEADAAAAYNWGPGNFDRWKASGASPAQLPAETRDYVAKVTRGQQGQTAAAAPAPAQPAAPQGTPGAMYGGQPDPQALQRQLADATRQYQYLQERMGIESDDAKRQQILGQMDAVKGAYMSAQTSFAYQTGNLPALVNIANSMGIPVGLRDAGNGQVIAVAQGQSSPPMDRAAAAQWLYGQVDAQQRAADAKRQEAYRAAEQKYQFDALLEREKGSQARQTEVLKGIREFEAKALEAGVKANEIKFERLENGGVVAVVRGQMYMVPTSTTAGGGASKFGGAVAAPLQPVSFGQ